MTTQPTLRAQPDNTTTTKDTMTTEHQPLPASVRVLDANLAAAQAELDAARAGQRAPAPYGYAALSEHAALIFKLGTEDDRDWLIANGYV